MGLGLPGSALDEQQNSQSRWAAEFILLTMTGCSIACMNIGASTGIMAAGYSRVR